MESMRTLCSSATCEHRSGNGYYGLCQHPACKQIIPYNGITRMYVDHCDLYERTKRKEHTNDR